jgi:hypothetical protein
MPWKAAWFKHFPGHDGRLRKWLVTLDSSGSLPRADSVRLDGEPVKQIPTVTHGLMYQPDKQVLACLMGSLRCTVTNRNMACSSNMAWNCNIVPSPGTGVCLELQHGFRAVK